MISFRAGLLILVVLAITLGADRQPVDCKSPVVESGAVPPHPYPLEGQHGRLPCVRCHPGPTVSYNTGCIDCHQDDIPAVEIRECRHCHLPEELSHNPVRETGATGPCHSCHAHHPTPVHYGRHCSGCHLTADWSHPGPDKTTALICSSCHLGRAPRPHYLTTGCWLCHYEPTWHPGSFDHRGFPSCTRCHTRPNGHRTGDCTFCHDTVDWGHAS